jgi:hypothetical protein
MTTRKMWLGNAPPKLRYVKPDSGSRLICATSSSTTTSWPKWAFTSEARIVVVCPVGSATRAQQSKDRRRRLFLTANTSDWLGGGQESSLKSS